MESLEALKILVQVIGVELIPQVYETWEIKRIAEVAFELAKKRNNKVTSSEKRNVMESGLLWNEEVTKLHKEKYSDVELEHMLADNCGMQLVRWPKQFDVIVTDNLFGRHAIRRCGNANWISWYAPICFSW